MPGAAHEDLHKSATLAEVAHVAPVGQEGIARQAQEGEQTAGDEQRARMQQEEAMQTQQQSSTLMAAVRVLVLPVPGGPCQSDTVWVKALRIACVCDAFKPPFSAACSKGTQLCLDAPSIATPQTKQAGRPGWASERAHSHGSTRIRHPLL